MAAEPGRRPDSGLPKRIGNYDAFLQIGSGGMARVFLAAPRGGGNARDLVVVKQLRRDIAEDEHALALFVDEARIAMQLDHPNVVRIREVVTRPPDYSMVMEFLDGPSLLQVLNRVGPQAMPQDAHIWVIAEVLAGLAHAHELRDASGRPLHIVHRDVSPSNVLVCYSGEVKLLDFGIAKATGAMATTHEGVVRGKLGYASPEQCLGKPVDARSDLYAVGVLLWEAIAGRRRAAGETRHSLLQARIDDSEPPLEVVAPNTPTPLLAIVNRALAYLPEARYRTARELKADLDAYLGARPQKITAPHVAALLAPHFAQERAELRRIVEAHFNSPNGRIPSGTRPVIPLRVPLAVAKDPAPPEPFWTDEEENTSRIPVDDLLLMKSRRESTAPPKRESGGPAARESRAPQGERPRSAPPPPLLPGAVTAKSGPGEHAPSAIAEVSPMAPTPQAPGPSSDDRRDSLVGVQARRSVWPMLLGAVVVSAGVAAAVASKMAGARAGVPLQTTTSAASSTGAGTGTASNPAPSPGDIQVRIAVTPSSAVVRLDGRLLNGNPFVGTFPRDGAEHEVAASAEDRVRQTRSVRFDGNLDLELSLESSGTTRSPPRTGARVASPVPAAPVLPAARAVETKPVATGVEPGMDLLKKPATRGKHTIDEKDPYAQ